MCRVSVSFIQCFIWKDSVLCNALYSRMNRGRRGFIPAETLVQNGPAGDNGTASGTLNQSVPAFLVG